MFPQASRRADSSLSSKPGSRFLLVADIGGTSARFALYRQGAHGDELFLRQDYSSFEFSSITPLLRDMVAMAADLDPSILIESVCIAAAGPVQDGVIQGVNLPWTITEYEVRAATGAKFISLLNDFEAAAWGLLRIDPKDVVAIGGPVPDFGFQKRDDGTGEPVALLGAGTGLGEALLVPCPGTDRWKVLRTEGGHATFAPRNQQELELACYLMDLYGHPSQERAVSGQGIVNIFRFLSGKSTQVPGNDFLMDSPAPREVAALARKGDPICCNTMDLFFQLFASEAGNLALKSLPKSGVFLAGGIINKNLDLVEPEAMRYAFEDKGRMKGLLQTIPLSVVVREDLGLLGALVVASGQSAHALS